VQVALGRERAVEQVVPLVREHHRVECDTRVRAGEKLEQPPARVAPAESNHLHGQLERLAEPRHPLAALRHHEEPLGGRHHDLLPKERRPAALDQAELGVDLVGAVDRQVEYELPVEGRPP